MQQYNFKKPQTKSLFESLVSLILIRFVMLALMLMFLVPKQEQKTAESQVKDRGTMRIECIWPDGTDIDVDLWAKAPGDNVVGFRNQNGEVFDLVRDDLGKNYNASGIHYEIIYARDIRPGEYIINVVLYRNGAKVEHPVVKVNCEIYLGKNEGANKRMLLSRSVELTRETEEQTIVSFIIDANKNVIESTISKVTQPIATAKKAGD